jgi:hypothetical protein
MVASLKSILFIQPIVYQNVWWLSVAFFEIVLVLKAPPAFIPGWIK